jgi:hypothetical protein
MKKNKKCLNIIYLSFKFPQFCELYFKEEYVEEGGEKLERNASLSKILS